MKRAGPIHRQTWKCIYEEETDMFRDVLYTTLDIEVAGWVRSLQLRGIELPDDLKDEVLSDYRRKKKRKQLRVDS